MNSASLILRYTFERYGRSYKFGIGYLVFLIIMGSFFSPWLKSHDFGSQILALPVTFVFFTGIFGFLGVDADLAARASTYPQFLLRMPVRTRDLVAWPMLASALHGAISWMLFAGFYENQCGHSVPIVWPALLIASITVTIQAVLWTPFPIPYLRIVLAIVLPIALGLYGLANFAHPNVDQNTPVLIFFTWFLGIFVLNLMAIRFARHGKSFALAQKPAAAKSSATVSKARRAEFRSAMQAQVWIEFKRKGIILPLITGIGLLIPTVVLICLQWTQSAPMNEVSFSGVPFGGSSLQTILVNGYVRSFGPVFVWIPILVSGLVGLGVGPSDARSTSGGFALFQAVRPFRSTQMYTAKLWSSLASCIAALLVAIPIGLVWALTPARDFGSPSTYLAVHLKYDTFDTLSLLVGTVFVVFVVAFRNQVCGFFTEYVPSREMAVLYPLGMVLLGVSTGGIVYMLLQWFPEHQKLAISLLVGTFIFLKVGYAIWNARLLSYFRPENRKEIFQAFGQWVIFSCAAAALVWWYLKPYNLGPTYSQPIPSLLAIMLVPLSRPILCRLLMEKGRHQGRVRVG